MKKTAALFFIITAAAALYAQNKYALVIGNADYLNGGSLLHAKNDTLDISGALEKLGYMVTLRHNLRNQEMVRALGVFMAQLKSDPRSEGFFWYSGNAMNIEGINYLLPIDVRLDDDKWAASTSFPVHNLINQLYSVRNKVNVLALDACWEPPRLNIDSSAYTDRKLKAVPGLLPNTLIVYASRGPAYVTTQSHGSLFAALFIRYSALKEPLVTVLDYVARDAMSATEGRQLPYTSGNLHDKYYSLNTTFRVRPDRPVVVPEMALINGGTFIMGSPAGEPNRLNNEGPQCAVTLSPFLMGKYEVTQIEYETIMGTNPSEFAGDYLPVENVHWYDAIEYCNRRSILEGLTPAYTIDQFNLLVQDNREEPPDTVRWRVSWNPAVNGYRLPTEAEWEYACRAGTTTPFYSDGDFNSRRSGGDQRQRDFPGTAAAGTFAPNPWGLYDMHGNVFEWCWDWISRGDDYRGGARTDPTGPPEGTYHVIRGGGWRFDAQYARSAARGGLGPSVRDSAVGFRVVRSR